MKPKIARRQNKFTPNDLKGYFGYNQRLIHERNKAKAIKKTRWWKNQIGQGVCYYCRQRVDPRDLTIDHKMPLAKGGKTTKSNVVTACQRCNRAKGSLVYS